MTKRKLYKVSLYSLLGIFVFVLLIALTTDGPKPTHQDRIKKQFDAWSGQHINLTEYIKKHMNDPDSYENVETACWDMDSFIVVNQKYSGKNAFGGRVQAFVKAKIDTEGKIIEIMEER